MKKLVLAFALVAGVCFTSSAQQGSTFATLGGGVFIPGESDMEVTLFGGGVSGGYGITDNIVGTLDLGYYGGSSDLGYDISTIAIGLSAKYYISESFDGFFIGPEFSYYSTKVTVGSIDDTEGDIGVGGVLGYTLAIGDNLGLEPHVGFGSWGEDTKGRILAGVKIGMKF